MTIELPDLPVLTPGDLPAMPTSPGELAKFVLTNPYAAVAVSVAAYLVVPRAAAPPSSSRAPWSPRG